MKKHCIPELLSPAGTKESIYSAVNNGCDAVYIGGKKFSARKYAANFSDDELIEIIDFCHIRNVKVFITINTLYKNSEINELLEFASKMYSKGADGFIIQDLGIFSILKSNFPSIRLHASTQMTAHNPDMVNFLDKLGFSRVVLSRELSLEEISDICEQTSLETEVFIHGALCVSYSGRCLMSSFIGNRSGNRGQCAQPCRLKYSLYKDSEKISENYLLSPKDIMTVNLIDKLIKCGVKSFKIEGRMKSPEYVAQVTKIYRKYINFSMKNDFRSPSDDDIKNLTQIFNRGGSFSSGYLNIWAGTEMISPSPKSSGTKIGIVKSYNKNTEKAVIYLYDKVVPGDGIEIWTDTEPHSGTGISKSANARDIITLKIKGNIKKGNYVYKSFDKALNDTLKKEYTEDIRKREVQAYITAKINMPLKLKLCTDDITIHTTGRIVSPAEKNPITEEELVKRLSKTGGTPYTLNFKEIITDDNIYIPISDINSLRRNALSVLEEKIISSYKKEQINISYTPKKRIIPENKYITVHLNTDEQFYTALNYKIKRIYFELNDTLIKNYKSYINLSHKNDTEFFICLPSIYRKLFFKDFSQIKKSFDESDADGYLVRNLSEINTNKKTVADYTLNLFNSASIDFAMTNFDEVTLSPELTLSELKETASDNTEIFTYGRLTLMTTHQCPIGLYAAKKEKGQFCKLRNSGGSYYLKDRIGADFPIQPDCLTCTSYILNRAPICILDKFNEISSIPAKYFRITLTRENSITSGDIIYSHIKLLSGEKPDPRIENTIAALKEDGITEGHFFKKVL